MIYEFERDSNAVEISKKFVLQNYNKVTSCGQMSSVFTNGPGDRGSIPGRVILKTPKMVLDAASLNTQHYKLRIKGKVEQSREWSNALLYTLVWYYLPTPLLGQDMTQGQFLSGV